MSRAGPFQFRAQWSRAATQLAMDLYLCLLVLLVLLITRVTLLAWFHTRIGPESDGVAIGGALLNGLRFDARAAVAFVLPLVAASIGCALADYAQVLRRVRALYGALWVAFTSFVVVVDVCFFEEFGDQFNAYALGVVYDDLQSILLTAWHGYPVEFILPLIAVLALGTGSSMIRLLWRVPRGLQQRLACLSPAAKVLLSAGMAGVLVLGVAGRTDRLLMRRDAWLGEDEFLNRIVLNPYQCLYYATKEHLKITRGSTLATFLPDGDLPAAAQRLLGAPGPLSSLDEVFARVAPGREQGAGAPPRHIFLVLMESYSSWTLEPRYRALGLSEGLRELAGRGAYVPRTVSAGHMTIYTLMQFITGLPYAGVPTNYHPASRQPFPTALAPQFERLGYRTRLITGGYLGWQVIGEFALRQGFDEVIGGASMAGASTTDWGVPDAELFDYIERTLDPEVPSFNLILTTTNHAPYDLPQTGAPRITLPPHLAEEAREEVDFNALGHHWYADHHLGRFVSSAERRFADSLFLITGDHTGHVYVSTRPSLLDQLTVPLVIYGPKVLGQERLPPGRTLASHLDVMPTLMHLAAPRGFSYFAVGQDLFTPVDEPVALGRNAALTGAGVVSFGLQPGSQEPWQVMGLAPAQVQALRSQVNDLMAISWQRLVKGPALAGQEGPSHSSR